MLPHCSGWTWLNTKQVLPRRESCWLASANGAVASSSPGKGRTALQTIVNVLPIIRSSRVEQLGAALAAEQLEQPAAEGAAAWQPTAASAEQSRAEQQQQQ